MKRILGLAFSIALALGGLATAAMPAGAVTSHVAHTTASPVPLNSGAFVMCDQPGGRNPILCANDSGFGCSGSTPVIGWQDVNTANEKIYETSQAGGYVNLHFQSCGNAWCIWQYGFGGSGNYLYMHACSGTANNDLFYIQNVGGASSVVRNKGDNQYLGAGTNQGQQLYTSTYNGGYSTWSAF